MFKTPSFECCVVAVCTLSMLRPSGVLLDGWRCDFSLVFRSYFAYLFHAHATWTRNLLSSVKNKRGKVVQERGRIAPQRQSVRAAIVCYCFAAKFTK